jgi:hypothetical protein
VLNTRRRAVRYPAAHTIHWKASEVQVKMAPKLLNILLQRDDSNVQWGFRISGGKDLAKPLTIVKVRNYIWNYSKGKAKVWKERALS